MRRRHAVPRTAYVLRHTSGGLSLARQAPAASGRRLWHGKLGFAVAVAVLAGCTALLQSGAYLRPAPARGPCPLRASTAAHAGGHQLLVRVEPALGPTALVHLCAGRAIGPVRAWLLRVEDGPAAAAQRVAADAALAAAPLPKGRRTSIAVVVIPRAGQPLTFTTQVTAG